ncbi:unannotated protein [freshwater metagenome]|uniref:Unannotated protein n=1 Tax=freshwater metagenome TaxID=449393 RepID=A0A6J6CDA5_9ZZZZ
METFPISSRSRRSFTKRAVIFAPFTRPAIGEVLIPIVIEIAGSSIAISGRGLTSSGSARVSPIVISSIPATATMSPGPADSVGKRSRALVISSSVIFTFWVSPFCLTQATCWPFLIVPLKTRSSARRPRKGDASRFVTCACSGASGSYFGAGMYFMIAPKSGSRSALSGSVPFSGLLSDAAPALPEA